MKKPDKTYFDRELPVAETENELATPLWQDFYLTNGEEILNVTDCFIEHSDKYGIRYNINNKWYGQEEIECINSQMPQPSHELSMNIVCGIMEILSEDD